MRGDRNRRTSNSARAPTKHKGEGVEDRIRRICRDALSMLFLPEKMNSPGFPSRGGEAWGDAGAGCELFMTQGKWQLLVISRNSALVEDRGFEGNRDAALEWAKAIVATEAKNMRRRAETLAFEYMVMEEKNGNEKK